VRTRLQVKLAMLLLLLTALPCVADERNTEIDRLFKAVDRNNGPGCAVSVYRAGKKLYEQGYGIANLEYGIPIRPSSAFQIGSATKQFTAMAVLLLAKDGKLAPLDDIHKYIPELPQYEAPVTIQEMLWHTSGLRDIYDLIDLRDRDDDSPLTQGRFLKIIAQQRSLNFNPGTGFLYSNSNYLLLAILVERTSGKQLNRFMEERIFGPLEMSHTILLDKKQWLVPNRAYSYSKDESGRYQNRFPVDEIVGSTGIFTTIEDIAKWNEELIGGAILGKEIVRQLEQTGTIAGGRLLEYGDGVVIARDRGLRTIGHGGADIGYLAVLFVYPDYDFQGAILCNTAELEPWNIARTIAGIYLREHMTEEAFSKVSSTKLEKYAGTYYSPVQGSTSRFVLESDQLLAGGNPRFALRQLGASKFQLADIPVYFEFYDHNGTIGLTRSMFGASPDVMLKMTPVEPPTSLSQYVGTYRAPELQQTFTISIASGTLVMSNLSGTKGKLIPTMKDGFSWDATGLFLRFQRANGLITGLTATTDSLRTWNLPFERLPN